MLNHYKGKKEFYSYQKNPNAQVQEHENGIYFTTDTHEILVNGEAYGGSNANCTTSDDIEISGGPLANDFQLADDDLSRLPESWKIKEGNTVVGYKIPSGASLHDILVALFLVEKWPTIDDITHSAGSLTASIDKPTITILKVSYNDAEEEVLTNVTSGSNIEVGTTIKVTVTPASSMTVTPTDSSLGEFPYGYSLSVDGPVIRDRYVTKTIQNIKILLDSLDQNALANTQRTYELSITANTGNKDNSLTWNNNIYTHTVVKQTSDVNYTQSNLQEKVFYFLVKSGENTINATNKGVISLGTSLEYKETYYLASSLRNLDENLKYSTEHNSVTIKSARPSANATQKSLTGKFYEFYKEVSVENFNNVTYPENTTDTLNGFTKVDSFGTKRTFNIAKDTVHAIYIVTTSEISKVTWTVSGDTQDWSKDMTHSTTEIELLDGLTQTYNVYMIKSKFPTDNLGSDGVMNFY